MIEKIRKLQSENEQLKSANGELMDKIIAVEAYVSALELDIIAIPADGDKYCGDRCDYKINVDN